MPIGKLNGVNVKKINDQSWAEISDFHPDLIKSKNYSYLLLETVGSTKILLGIENTTGHKCVAFLAKRDLYEKKEFPLTDGLEVRADIFRNDENKDAVILKLVKDDYADVFYTLVEDVLFYTEGKTKEAEFIEAFFSRLGVWKLFLKNAGPKGMGPDRRRGLFGELFFLDEVLIPNLGEDALSTWVGPDQASHDIQAGVVGVEIKTSAGTKSQKIHISSERQLDNDGFDHLYVYQLSITARKNIHPSLNDMVESVREKIRGNGTLVIHFNTMLLRSGYNEIHKDLYMNEGYHVEEINIFEVKDGFPRIVGHDLMPGVGGLKYTVDLSAIEKFKAEEETFLENLKVSYERK
jgi:hypothetical protein